MKHIKKSAIFLSAFFLFLFSQNAIAAEGDIIWAKTNNPTDGADTANKVISDSSGLYVVGYEGYGSPLGMKMRIEKRSHADGNIIWEKTFNPRNQGYAEIKDIAIDQGALYIVGYNYVCCFNTDYEWRAEKRSLSDGSLIWSVGNNLSIGDFKWDMALGVSVDSTGVYIAGGEQAQSTPTPLWRTEKRSLSDGSLVWSRSVNTGGSYPYDIDVDSSGLYAIGTLYTGGKTQWYIVKSSLFDGNNILWAQTTNFSSSASQPQGVSVNSSGVYLVGPDPYWAVNRRDLNNGNLISHTTDFSAASGYPLDVDISLSNTGNVYIAGYTGSPDSRWRIERRSKEGLLSPLWPKEPNPTPYRDIAYGLSINPVGGSIYTVGQVSSPSSSDTSWHIEKREIITTSICTGPVSIAWTDANIIAGTTKIRAVHINELRVNTNLRRQDAGLTDYTWTDSTLATGTTKIKTAHLQEIRNAISEVYTTCGQTTPTFTDSTLTAGATKIRKTHIDELRATISSAP